MFNFYSHQGSFRIANASESKSQQPAHPSVSVDFNQKRGKAEKEESFSTEEAASRAPDACLTEAHRYTGPVFYD